MKNRISLVLTIIMLLTLLNSITISNVYATYDPCDVNHDGNVTIADVILIEKYLSGDYYCATYNQFDANQNLIIDHSDSDMIMAAVVHNSYVSAYYSRAISNTVSPPTINGFSPNLLESSTTSREYMRYSYSTNTQLTNYFLTPSSPIQPLNTLNETDAIIDGFDSRYAAYGEENTGLVYLTDHGTGFIVGDHEIATAAHCVYNKVFDEWYSMVIQTYNSNGLLSSTYLTPKEVHIPKNYDTSHTPDSNKYDYALITVEEDLSNYIHFDLATSYNVSEDDYSNIPLFLTGCPETVNITGENPISNTINRLYSEEGNVLDQNYEFFLHYDIDSTTGDSGAPVYTITQNTHNNTVTYNYTVLAIHHGGYTGSYNFGTIITKYQLQFYRNNPYISY